MKEIKIDSWGVVAIISFMLVALMVGVMIGRSSTGTREVIVVKEVIREVNITTPFDYAEDALNKRIAGMVARGSHPYMGDITTSASGGGWGYMDSTCEGRKFLYYVSHNRSFDGFDEKCSG